MGRAALALIISMAILVGAGPLGAQDTATPGAGTVPLRVDEFKDRLEIRRGPIRLAEFVFRDEKIRRSYFANVLTPGGLAVTRGNPPAADREAVDHAELHPGVWLAFGDIQGTDFWRNQGRIEHIRFVDKPQVQGSKVTFSTESHLKTPADKVLAELVSQLTISVEAESWRLVWDATFNSREDLVFGDQEEMGFGVRLATPLTELKGGTMVNSRGQINAAATWGQPAAWCDCSGEVSGQLAGVLLMASPGNFRESWWHNRNYGLSVANAFGRAAMKQGSPSRHVIKAGQPFRLVYGVVFHQGFAFDPNTAYRAFEREFKTR